MSTSSPPEIIVEIPPNLPNPTPETSQNDAQNPTIVRINLISYLLARFKATSLQSRVLLIFSVVFLILQIVLITTVLIINAKWPQMCDVPLTMFLGVYLGRSLLALPLTIWQHLHSSGTSRAGQFNAFWGNEEGDAQWQRQEREQRVTTWVDRCKSLLDLFSVMWFLVGNYYVFTSLSCRITSPLLFYTSLTLIIFGYIVMSVPVLLCGAVVFCLPCVLLAMRHIQLPGLSPQDNQNSASESIIKGLEVRKVKIKTSSQDTARTEEEAIPVQQPTKWWWPKNPLRRHVMSNSMDVAFLELSREDAQCVICLASYEDGEMVKLLGCGHHFHPECVDEWLRINRKCPLCVRDVVETSQPIRRSTLNQLNPFRRRESRTEAMELPTVAPTTAPPLESTIGVESIGRPSIAPSFRTSIDGLIRQ